MKTKQTLGYISNQKDEKATQFEYLRLRTKQDTEMIVTNYVATASGNEYILVVNQSCKFKLDDEMDGEEGVAVWWEAHYYDEDKFVLKFTDYFKTNNYQTKGGKVNWGLQSNAECEQQVQKLTCLW